MKYLLVLDRHSAIGGVYAHGNDGAVKGEHEDHPGLVCSQLDLHSPNYIFAVRPLKKAGSHQSLHVPHHSVVAIFVLEEGQPNPIGFRE